MSEEHRKKYFPPNEKGRTYYPFYQVKDGDDCLVKTATLSLYSGAIGTSFAVIAGLTSTTPNNPALGSNLIIRLPKYGLPMFAAGGMFAASTCVVSNLRGKDDPWNHFAGGLATGSVFGTALKSQKLGWGLGVTFAFFAMLMKAGKQEGFANFSFDTVRRSKAFDDHRRSYFCDRPKPEGDQTQ